MSPSSVLCPACGAEQSSAYGFAPGQAVRCGRCAAAFRAPGVRRVVATAVDDDADDDADDDDTPPRRGSWLPLLGGFVAVVALGALGAAYIAAQRERAEEEQASAEEAAEDAQARAARKGRPFPAMERVNKAGGRGNGLPDLLPQPTAKQTAEATADLTRRLAGVWVGGGREVEYRADGTFADGPLAGTWKVRRLSGSRVLSVERSAGRSPVRVTFEGDELLHDDGAGESSVLRRK